MKTLRLKLFYLLFGFSLLTFGQTLEKTYISSAGQVEEPPNFAFYANDEMHYFTTEGSKGNITFNIKFYDTSHQEKKNITIATSSRGIEKVGLPSDKLFNSDSKIEFLLLIESDEVERYSFKLFNEDGDELFDFGMGYNYKLFKDHNNNFKLLITDSDKAKGQNFRVYGLSGTLSTEQENLLLSKVTTFPNPSSKVLNISNLKKHNGFLEVYTITGKKVFTKKVDKSLTEISFDISSLSKGVYFYKIGKTSNKFIKK
ncbi:T9SS type A sorting domain-containing protein [Polaribacter haliotis]|uniref:T9SS type A sorting domain-containing protein n=1 Tax=Polaribacter haliotis TaxID=1888915 RepID=A0A7L8ABG7_9FLAO|nr:T9SS type A sorting domain-containing protein [Polaribacter haliotis]QOD59350.1 T9SS type A sorting domain-containing protein [Polaribacter haliotis]